MNKHPHRRPPLFLRLTIWIMVCWFALLSITMALTLHYAQRTFQSQLDDTLISTVRTLADSPAMRQILREGHCTDEMADYLNSLVDNTSNLDYITIADTDSIRLFHIDPACIGQPFEGGDQQRALNGESYLTDANPEHFPQQRRAFHPVTETDGRVLGFVMASASHDRITALRSDIYASYYHLFLILTVCTLLFSGLLAMFLHRYLRGVRPEDLVRAYLTQNDILNALDEGLVSFDTSGSVRLVNAAAARMLGQRADLLMGRQVDDLLRAEDGSSLRGRESKSLQSSRPNVLVQTVRLPDSSHWARQVLILADKSELMHYAEELGGTRHMLSALRASTHEFLNKLQVISGLLQMGFVNEALDYIGTLSTVHEHILGPVMKLIHDSNVAALILGKEFNMRELDIELVLLSNSFLPEQSRYLSTRELVTVVGNLLENAMEAVNAAPAGGLRGVALQIAEDEQGLLIMVSDTGVGIRPEDMPHIFENGFSTKAQSGRGTGMNLIQEIADHHGGSIEVDTEPGSGTTISIIFSRERGETA